MMTRSRSCATLGPATVLAIVAATAPAVGQEEPLRRLDPLREDVGVLSTSLQVQPGELLVPSGFEHVYQVPGHPELKMRVDGGLYAVFRDSVYVMDRFGFSHPQISNDTVFFIGRPTAEALAALAGPAPPRRPAEEDEPGSSLRLDPRIDTARHDTTFDASSLNLTSALRIDTGITGARADREEAPAPPPIDVARTITHRPAALDSDGPTIVTDQGYRSRRMRALMQRAAAARRSREAG